MFLELDQRTVAAMSQDITSALVSTCMAIKSKFSALALTMQLEESD